MLQITPNREKLTMHMDDVRRGKSVVWRVFAILCVFFLTVVVPAGCSRRSADDASKEEPAGKIRSAPVTSGQDSMGKPQASPSGKAAIENNGKSGEEEDQEEPESQPDDE